MTELDDIIGHLRHYAFARNRAIDREVRTIEITDDEAIELLELIDAMVKLQ